MPSVLITTDFSAASAHALDYACALLHDKDVTLNLLHVFAVPVTYTSDGMALAAMGDALGRSDDLMENEVQRAKTAYPGIQVEGRLITGGFLETLQQESRATKPLFIILGTVGFNDLYLGDDDPLNALRTLQTPVLFVPLGATIRPIKNIAYASNYAYVGQQTPVPQIINWVRFMSARLQVVHSDAQAEGSDPKQTAGKDWLKGQLAQLGPSFHWVQNSEVIRGLSTFISQDDIDCVLVVPRKYGLFQSIFHKSRTKALARLNKIPILAFHELNV